MIENLYCQTFPPNFYRIIFLYDTNTYSIQIQVQTQIVIIIHCLRGRLRICIVKLFCVRHLAGTIQLSRIVLPKTLFLALTFFSSSNFHHLTFMDCKHWTSIFKIHQQKKFGKKLKKILSRLKVGSTPMSKIATSSEGTGLSLLHDWNTKHDQRIFMRILPFLTQPLLLAAMEH